MSVDRQAEPVSFIEIKGSIGSILFLWSSVERELSKGIETLDEGLAKNRVHGISRKISHWVRLQMAACAERPEHRALLLEIRKRLTLTLAIRNCIAHGLIGISADPSGHSGDASLTTEMNGEMRKLHHAELDQCMRILSHLIWAIGSLSQAAKQTDLRQAQNAYLGIRQNNLP